MSSSRDGRRAFNAELPVEVLDAVKEESEKTGKPMWEILNDSARMFLGLDEVSTEASVQRHIERLEDEVDDLQTQKEEIVTELSTKKDRLEDYREKLDEIQDQKESYESRLDSILDELEEHANRKVIAFRSEIKELATDQHGQPTPDNREKIKEDLWERAMDQQRDVAPYQFNESTSPSQSVAATDGGTKDDPNSNLSSLQKLRNEDSDDSDDSDDDPEIMTDGGVDRPNGAMQHRKKVEESILDATCGGRSIWLPGRKDHDQTLYVDNRELESTGQEGRTYSVEPDEIQDFRDLEYSDEQFDLVVFDPPHAMRQDGQADLKGYVTKAYGALHAETWQHDLRRGFEELFRVLKAGGVLVFKFADNAVDFDEVLDLAPTQPLFGTTSKKNNIETRWFVFYKEGDHAE